MQVKDNYVYDVQFSNESSDEPVSLEQAKAWLYMTGSDQDAVLDSVITAARMQVEHLLNMGLVKRRIVATVNNSLGGITLPYQPFISMVSVVDSEGNELTADEYTLSGNVFKKLDAPHYDKLTITYNAGYTSNNKPSQAINAIIRAQIAHLYEHRGDTEAAGISPMALSLAKQIKVS